MEPEITGGLALSALAGLSLYLSGANQRLIAARPPRGLSLFVAAIAAAAAAWLLTRRMGSGSAIFTEATAIMTMLTLLPFVALLRAPAGKPPC